MGVGLVLRSVLGFGAGLALLIGGLFTTAALLPGYESDRLAAQSRWEQRSFAGYRMLVEVERFGRACRQELAMEGGAVQLIYDGCRIGWLPELSVPRLFELSQRLERPADCFPGGDCACARVRRGSIIYDEQLGFPRSIVIQRTVLPNWDHIDYWRRFWRTWSFPECSSMRYGITVNVLALTPSP